MIPPIVVTDGFLADVGSAKDLVLGVINGSPTRNPSPKSLGNMSSPPSPSPSPSPSSASTAPALVLSNSAKRMDQAGKKKYVRQVTGRHNDTEIHLAAQRGDLAAVRQILRDIDAQMTETAGGEEFDAEVAEIRSAIVNEANDQGDTALVIAAGKGYLDVVEELLKYADKETLTRKNQAGFDALHMAAKEGHQGKSFSSARTSLP